MDLAYQVSFTLVQVSRNFEPFLLQLHFAISLVLLVAAFILQCCVWVLFYRKWKELVSAEFDGAAHYHQIFCAHADTRFGAHL